MRWSSAGTPPSGVKVSTQGVVAVVQAIGHAQAQAAVELAVVAVADLGAQAVLAVDEGEAGAWPGRAGGVEDGDVDPGVAQRVLRGDRAGVVDGDDDPAGAVEADAVLDGRLAIDEDLEAVAARLRVPGELVAAPARRRHGELLAEVGGQGDECGDRLGGDLAGEAVIAEVRAGSVAGHTEEEVGAVRVAALAQGAVGVAGGDDAEGVVAGRHGEDGRPRPVPVVLQLGLRTGGVKIGGTAEGGLERAGERDLQRRRQRRRQWALLCRGQGRQRRGQTEEKGKDQKRLQGTP